VAGVRPDRESLDIALRGGPRLGTVFARLPLRGQGRSVGRTGRPGEVWGPAPASTSTAVSHSADPAGGIEEVSRRWP
jgi:hypothetical protein